METYGALPSPVLCPVVLCILNGLLYLWDMKIIHRGRKFVALIHAHIVFRYEAIKCFGE
jgi:hypothetical protein